MIRILLAAGLAFLAGGCATVPAPTAPSVPDPTWPIGLEGYRTTAASIYLGNLDARISELQRGLASQDRPDQRTALAASLYHRYRVLGRFADAEEALRLLDAAVAAEPGVALHRVTRGVVLAGFHRFDDALADLEAAEQAGADPRELLGTRREILLARGDYTALADEFARSADLSHDFLELAHRADLRVLQGDLEGATFRYRAAQAQYRDVNPFPLAWLHVQQGIAFLRHERLEDARRFFEAAHARMPTYYLATEHLAETETRLGNVERARALYAQVIEQTGNPEFIAALAGLERDAGNERLAQTLARQAEAGYAQLLRVNPSAYAQHAAEFFVEIDKPRQAHELARQNLALRRDIGSLILLATTARAAGDHEQACEARAQALGTGLKPPELAELEAIGTACDR